MNSATKDPETGAWTGVASVVHLLSRKNGGLNTCASEFIRDLARTWGCESFADYGAGTGAYAPGLLLEELKPPETLNPKP